MRQLSLFESEKKKSQIFYKVRLTNLLQRSFNDKINIYNNLEDAEKCVKKWQNESIYNVAIIEEHQRQSILGLIN